MTNLIKVYVGVDVSKRHLDIYIHPIEQAFQVENNAVGFAKIKKSLSQFCVEQIVCESSGGYEQAMLKMLAKHGYRTWCVDPNRVKGFIASEGIKFKTDANDAKMIALFASQKKCNYQKSHVPEEVKTLQIFVKRRTQLIAMASDEKKRLQQFDDKIYKTSINRIITMIEKEIGEIQEKIDQLTKDDDTLNQKKKIMESVPGIGSVTTNALLAQVPELGSLTGKQIAALVGVAPYTKQSGIYVGRSTIYGGRAEPRHALYMAALSAARSHSIFKIFYDRLIAAGKKPKVAITAVMRKIIVCVNAMLAKGELWKTIFA